MALDTSTGSALLKNFYEPQFTNVLNSASRMYALVKRKIGTKHWTGNQVVAAAKTRRSTAAGASANSVLATARNVQTVNWNIPRRFLQGVIQVSEEIHEATRNNMGAFMKATRLEIEGMEESLIRSLNRQLMGTGDGKIAEVLSVSSPTVTLRTTGGSGWNGNAGARHIYPDMLLEVRVGATGTSTRQASLRVDTVDYDANTFTISAGSLTGVAAADSVYIEVAAGTNSQNNEVMGLGGAIDSTTYVGTFQGLSRTTYPVLRGNVNGTVGTNTALTMSRLQRVMDLTYLNGGQCKIDFFICSPGVREEAAKIQQLQQRWTKIADQGQGFKEDLRDQHFDSSVTWNNIPFVIERDAPYYEIFGVCLDSFTNYIMRDFKWGDMDGSVWSRVQGYAAYDAFLTWYGNFACLAPNRNFVLRGVTQTLPSGLVN